MKKTGLIRWKRYFFEKLETAEAALRLEADAAEGRCAE